ncbi:MAG TPA: hypothetical protein DCP92_13165 [Nitrospiraceae bacterium]|nr:hypothetical protein [Nitrospiraceae bacterium]
MWEQGKGACFQGEADQNLQFFRLFSPCLLALRDVMAYEEAKYKVILDDVDLDLRLLLLKKAKAPGLRPGK